MDVRQRQKNPALPERVKSVAARSGAFRERPVRVVLQVKIQNVLVADSDVAAGAGHSLGRLVHPTEWYLHPRFRDRQRTPPCRWG
jgi:hypothetical protein